MSPSHSPRQKALVAAILALATGSAPAFAQFLHTDAGPYDYNNTANWNGGTVNNQLTSTLSASQTVTFAADTTLSGSLTINNNSVFNHTFLSSGANRTLTMGGNLSLGSNASNANTVTFGSTTEGQQLNIDLGANRTFFAGTNRTLDIVNVISGAFNLTKTGNGIMRLTGTANTYTGSTSIGTSGQVSGVLEVTKLADSGVASSIGASTSATGLVFGGTTTGTLRYVGSGDSTNRRFLIGGVGANFDASGTGAVLWTNTSAPTYASTGNARTITFSGTNTADNTMSASFNDSGAGKTSIAKTGTGTWVLAGANTATGDITVSEGTLALGAADRLADLANLVMNGGTFDTRGFSETLGTLTLSADSIIDLGAGNSDLVFAASGAAAWGESFSLSFMNFTEGVDSIRFGLDQDGLTLAQLAQITINGGSVGIDTQGYLTLAAIPEPSAFALLAGAGTLAIAGLRRRR
ncbi:MAG: autotransporter-associated beta strand repeat-containing protein [Verrucomicrobiota bacterium]